jgi:hypothetical protein
MSLSSGQYNWYQRGPTPFALATSSIEDEEAVERI